MPRRNPAEFPLDDQPIYDAYVASRRHAALVAGVRLRLFDLLDAKPRTAAELGHALSLRPRPMGSLLGALYAMGVVTRVGAPGSEIYGLSPEAAQYVVRGKPGSLWALIDMEVEHPLTPARLLDSLKSDQPSVYDGVDPWESHVNDPDAALRFTEAMHSVSERPAAGLAEVAELRSVDRLLDVGGGSGALSIALARTWPDLHCTVFDLPVVCDQAQHFIDKAGLGQRVEVESGDMLSEAFPPGHDAVLFSQILHDWSPDTCADLLGAARDALPVGGRVFIHEKLVADDGTGPLANALVHLDMLVWTEGQQWTEAGLRALLAAQGFERVTCAPTAGYWSLVTGIKA